MRDCVRTLLTVCVLLSATACAARGRPSPQVALERYYASADYVAQREQALRTIERVQRDAAALRALGRPLAAASATTEAVEAASMLLELGAPSPEHFTSWVLQRAHLRVEAGACAAGHELLGEIAPVRAISPPLARVITPSRVLALHEAAVHCALAPSRHLLTDEDPRLLVANWQLVRARDTALVFSRLDSARLAYLHAEVAYATASDEGDSLYAEAESQSMRMRKRDYPAWQQWSARTRRERAAHALVRAIAAAPDTTSIRMLLAAATPVEVATASFARASSALQVARQLQASGDTTGASEALMSELAALAWFNFPLAARLDSALRAVRDVPPPGNPWVERDVRRALTRRWWLDRLRHAESLAAPASPSR